MAMVYDPVQRVNYCFSRSGEVLRVDVSVEPGGGAIIEHLHPRVEEAFEVLDGEIAAWVDGREFVVGPGGRAVVPAGSRHGFVNTATTTAHLLVTIDPAARMREFLTDAAQLARDGCYSRRGTPNGLTGILRIAALATTYREDVVFTGGIAPPPAWQPALLAPLAWLARVLNLPPTHERGY